MKIIAKRELLINKPLNTHGNYCGHYRSFSALFRPWKMTDVPYTQHKQYQLGRHDNSYYIILSADRKEMDKG